MARESHDLGRRIKSGIVVVVITLLIWFAADQSVVTDKAFPIEVILITTDPDRFVSLAEAPYQETVRVTLEGRRRRIEAFRREISQRSTPFQVDLGSSQNTSPDPQFLNTTDVLKRIPEILDSKLSIKSVTPKRLHVRIDRMVPVRNIAVEANYGDLQVNAEIDPPLVTVRMPEFAKELLSANPVALIRAEADVRANLQPDRRFEIKPTLESIKGLDPQFSVDFVSTRTVTIRGRVEAQTETLKKGPIQITWSIPNDVQRNFTVVAENENFRPHIEVTGPKGRVEQLDPANIRALVDVLAGDVDDPGANQEITRKVRFFLPTEFSDCTIKDPDANKVKFKLEPRNGS